MKNKGYHNLELSKKQQPVTGSIYLQISVLLQVFAYSVRRQHISYLTRLNKDLNKQKDERSKVKQQFSIKYI